MNALERPQECFIVFALRHNIDIKDPEDRSLSTEVLGIFGSLEDAKMYMDINSGADSTMEAVTISSATFMSKVPVIEIFLHVSISDDDEIVIRSRCVENDTVPWIREQPDYFEALCYPEDREHIVDRASTFLSRRGLQPVVLDEIAPGAQDYI